MHFPKAARIRVVLDSLSTHSAGALYQTFPATQRICGRSLIVDALEVVGSSDAASPPNGWSRRTERRRLWRSAKSKVDCARIAGRRVREHPLEKSPKGRAFEGGSACSPPVFSRAPKSDCYLIPLGKWVFSCSQPVHVAARELKRVPYELEWHRPNNYAQNLAPAITVDATAMITATDTMRLLWRTFSEVASIHR